VELLQPRIAAGSSVIELGCGVGRITRELLARGYRVTAVDNSPEMLLHVPSQATKICADIEALVLETTFDAVILASCLVNVTDSVLRAARLAKCRDLLKPGGQLILERYDPGWLADVQIGPLGNFGDIEMHLDDIHRNGADVDICLRYRRREEEWLHYFSAAVLDDDEICSCLLSAGFAPPSWIDRRWASAGVMKNVA
jgi:SAM-dependent methyltransferase